MMCACHVQSTICSHAAHDVRATNGMTRHVLPQCTVVHHVEELTSTTDAYLDLIVTASIPRSDIEVVSDTIEIRSGVKRLAVQSRVHVGTTSEHHEVGRFLLVAPLKAVALEHINNLPVRNRKEEFYCTVVFHS